MISIKQSLFLFTIFFLVFSCSQKKDSDLIIDFSNPAIDYSGRIDTSNQAADLYWSGTSIRINFEGTSIAALLEDEHGDNYYNVIIDEGKPFILRPDSVKNYHSLASNLSKGKHTLELFKRTEWDRGKTTFYGFHIKGTAKILPKSAAKNMKIEFYGNSISAGYAVEDFSGDDSPDSTFTNNHLSYTAITARHFDSDYRCICRSGIGVMVSWFPLTMPEMYNRLIPEDTTSRWDFSLYTPDVVVINLFQNDSWLVDMPDYVEFKARFDEETPDDDFIIQSYMDFVSSIRKEYPMASIICALGAMDATQEGSEWPGFIESAVAELDDDNIYTHFMPYKNTPGHPSIAEQEVMAKSLIRFIKDTIKW